MKTFRGAVLTLALIGLGMPLAQGMPTDVTVRVRADDAKFIGSGMGGMEVVIYDVASGNVLAEGMITGGTGDTELLMKTPEKRGMQLAVKDTAGYTATLNIEEPTLVRIDVRGPLQPAPARQSASLTTWVAPGKHISGDGIIINLPGHAVALNNVDYSGLSLAVKADVTMMCGCPFTAGGLWDADRLQVRGMLRQDDKTLATFPLTYTGSPNQFSGETQLEQAPQGSVELFVYAYDPQTGKVLWTIGEVEGTLAAAWMPAQRTITDTYSATFTFVFTSSANIGATYTFAFFLPPLSLRGLCLASSGESAGPAGLSSMGRLHTRTLCSLLCSSGGMPSGRSTVL